MSRTLSSSIDSEKDAAQSGWAELFDIYLKEAITTPWGSVSTLRLCSVPGGVAFFTPNIEPEPSGNQGAAQDYEYWPIQRENIRSSAKNANDKFQIVASNVSTDWAQMLEDVDWYDTPVVVRKISLSIASPGATDTVVLAIGQVDAVDETPEQITLHVSGDMSGLNVTLPRENMHQNCRFRWADDWCGKLRFHQDNYKSKTVGSSSTTTAVKSAGLTEDSGSSGSYGTDEVDALSNVDITASTDDAGGAKACTANPTWDFISANDPGVAEGDPITFSGSAAPGGLSFGPTYYVRSPVGSIFQVASTPGGTPIDITSAGTSVSYSRVSHNGYQVRASNPNHWKFELTDWGTLTNGYWEVTGGQEGYENEDLTPYLEFDFGSAKQLKLWRIKGVDNGMVEDLVRWISIYSSTDTVTWAFESHFELPPVGGVFWDVKIPEASSARYWRICIRTKWARNITPVAFDEVQAYEDSRHYWAHGRITFDAATTTAALRGLSRKVMESYNGEVIVSPPLPTAPVSGDTFVIERGCPRTIAGCCERKNTLNFGGQLDLPNQTIIR